MIATVYEKATGYVLQTVSVAGAQAMNRQADALPAGYALAVGVEADTETEIIAGRDTDTPYAAPQPELVTTATRIAADGVDEAVVEIPAGVSADVSGREKPVVGPVRLRFRAFALTTWRIEPSRPYKHVEVIAR
jgi:hypothetical protein